MHNKIYCMTNKTAAHSAIHKLEEFYRGLPADERKIIALILSSTLQRAARAQAERDWLVEREVLLELITPEHAPVLVTELGTYVAGQIMPPPADKRPLT